MTDWDSEEWTYSVKRLVDWASTVDSEQPLMLMVRHSHREVMHTHEAVMQQELTELGKRISTELGKRIPTVRKAQIFHSYISRCYQTAEAISSGFSSVGGEVLSMDPDRTLTGPNTDDVTVWKNLWPDGENVTDFANNWIDGKFGQRIESFEEFGAELIDNTVKRLLSTKGNIMQIHATHDLSLMCTKRILFDRALTLDDREPFLGGIGITVEDSIPILFVKGKTSAIDPVQ